MLPTNPAAAAGDLKSGVTMVATEPATLRREASALVIGQPQAAPFSCP